ncbi:MAG: hypothetical protein Q9217_004483 [Psora testacea]
MAAIDPSATPEQTGTVNGNALSRATLKMVYGPAGPVADELDDFKEGQEYLKSLLEGRESDGLSDEDDDEVESSDDEDTNGGPSDPSKSKKARKEAAAQELLKALLKQEDDGSEDEIEVDQSNTVNGVGKKGKGKAKASDSGDEEIDSDVLEDTENMKEVIICTLDPEKTYQQPIDITIPENQPTYFEVSGTHAIYLTGNYIIPPDEGHDHEDSEEDDGDYDLSPDEDELELEDVDESDELDDLEDPRITEIDSEEDAEAPHLTEKQEKRAQPANNRKNKRPAEDSEEEATDGTNLDDIMAKSLKPTEATTNGEPKLSKKQMKKLKNNAGKAVETAGDNRDVKKEGSTAKSDKKVQFANNLEQGPASSSSTMKAETDGDVRTEVRKEKEKPKASLGVKMVQGVKIDDKKLGKGPAAKKGDKLGMRYIGKLSDGKIFDANKKGPPFRFKLGAGQVIKGWDIGVAGMSVEGERRIVIPPSLGYGSQGTAGVPGNSELTFDIKLLEIS